MRENYNLLFFLSKINQQFNRQFKKARRLIQIYTVNDCKIFQIKNLLSQNIIFQLLREMIGFNIDFLTNHARQGSRSSRSTITLEYSTKKIVQSIQEIQKIKKLILIKNSFDKIRSFRKNKNTRFLLVSQIYTRRLFTGFFSIKSFSISKDKSLQMKFFSKDHSFAFKVLHKTISSKVQSYKQLFIEKLRQRKQHSIFAQIKIDRLKSIVALYENKFGAFPALLSLKKDKDKKQIYTLHALALSNSLVNILVQKLSNTINMLMRKTQIKCQLELQMQRNTLKDKIKQITTKRNDFVNQLKKRITNMKGQVNQGKIQINKKKNDISRQLGAKLMKKNQQMRLFQINISQFEFQIEKLEKNIYKKQCLQNARSKAQMQPSAVISLYRDLYSLQKIQKKGNQIFSKFPKSHFLNFTQSLSHEIIENNRLRNLINLYEGIAIQKKSDVYSSAEQQNVFLKNLISSILKMIYFENHRKDIQKRVDIIYENLDLIKKDSKKGNIRAELLAIK